MVASGLLLWFALKLEAVLAWSKRKRRWAMIVVIAVSLIALINNIRLRWVGIAALAVGFVLVVYLLLFAPKADAGDATAGRET